MKKIVVCTVLFFRLSVSLIAQEFVPLWQEHMPNSRGLSLTDSVSDERIHQVAIPGCMCFRLRGKRILEQLCLLCRVGVM
ncbi:MAG: hypothetical protein LUF85_07690 [Bacteroides sp.]|nr:hypothetical protein [Bacteroides sp.]